jgi:capsular polysaccharide biosynthesis protein
MKVLFPENICKRKAPVNITESDITLFSHEYEKKIHATSFTELKNVYILNNTIFNLKSLQFYNKHSLVHPITKKQLIKNLILLSKKGKSIQSAVWIIDENAYGYFHWLTDCLCRLVAINHLLKDESVILPNHLKNIKFIEESLQYFNIKAEYYDLTLPVKVKRLLLPSHTAPSGNYNSILVNKLRQQFVGQSSIHATKKIYISRQNAEKRKITNEEAVIALLKQYHFEIHFFENYSFTEQINLMKDTKCLIGLHGAGLTNMLFMSEKTKVLELRNEEDSHNNCYFSLASDLNLDYYYQLNKGDKKNTHDVNINVDILLLKQNIESLLSL